MLKMWRPRLWIGLFVLATLGLLATGVWGQARTRRLAGGSDRTLKALEVVQELRAAACALPTWPAGEFTGVALFRDRTGTVVAFWEADPTVTPAERAAVNRCSDAAERVVAHFSNPVGSGGATPDLLPDWTALFASAEVLAAAAQARHVEAHTELANTAHIANFAEIAAVMLLLLSSACFIAQHQRGAARRATEEALRASEAFTRSLLDTVGALVVALDVQGRIVSFNRACERLTGYTADEVHGQYLWDQLLLPEEIEPVRSVFERLTAGDFPNQYENYWCTRDGRRRLIAWSNTCVTGTSGDVQVVMGTGLDVTERREAEEARRAAYADLEKRVAERTAELVAVNAQLRGENEERLRAEQALRESERFAQSIFNAIVSQIAVLDEEGRIVAVNESWRQVAREYTAGPARTCEGADFLAECRQAADRGIADASEVGAAVEAVIRGRRDSFETEYALCTPGEPRYYIFRVARFPRPGPTRVVVMYEDITTHKLAEERARLAERLASLGTLAAGIAHEINNPTGAILLAATNAQRFRGRADGGPIVDRCLEDIVHNAKRCGRIVKSVLQFARQEPTEKWPNDLNDIVKRAVDLMKRNGEYAAAAIEFELAPGLPRLLLSPIEIEQVVINLVRNALEAGDHGSVVTVRTRRMADGVELAVCDRGRGIAPEQQSHLFDPFYTTRRHAGGTGLGLTLAHGIIVDHGARIEVQSHPGQGTTISVAFPNPPAEDGAGPSPAAPR